MQTQRQGAQAGQAQTRRQGATTVDAKSPDRCGSRFAARLKPQEDRMTASPVDRDRHIRPVGPVDVLIVGFADAKPDGTIAEAVAELVANGTVRILDALIVYKNDDGEVTMVEVTDVDGDGIPDLVAIQGDVPGLLTDADARAA